MFGSNSQHCSLVFIYIRRVSISNFLLYIILVFLTSGYYLCAHRYHQSKLSRNRLSTLGTNIAKNLVFGSDQTNRGISSTC